MDTKKIALLVGALFVAAISAFFVNSLISGNSTQTVAAAPVPTEAPGTQVLVATRALPVGTIITTDSIRFQKWPKDMVENAYFVQGQANMDSLIGTVVRNPITAGQPLTQGALVKPGDRGFLAAALGPGMRAVTVTVNAQSGVAGFVFPGDRIDLIMTQSVEGEGASLRTSETIVRNLRVLAADQRTAPQGEDANKEIRVMTTVTLEVTPRIAEKIAVAQNIGTLSLSLRSIADNTVELERAIAAGEVQMPDGKDPKKESEMLLSVASRPSDSDTTYVTGGDVSRFQRRTVPTQTRAAPTAAATPTAPTSVPSGEGVTTRVPVVSVGPVVRISRGNNVTEQPVGGK